MELRMVGALSVLLVLLVSLPTSNSQTDNMMATSLPKPEFSTCPLEDAMGILCPLTALCIPSFLVCDGFDDCGAGEDEEDCPASPKPEFATCPLEDAMGIFCPVTTLCIPSFFVCDGFDDCGAGEDEEDCPVDDSCESLRSDADTILQKCMLTPVEVSGRRGPVDSNTWVFGSADETTFLDENPFVTGVVFDVPLDEGGGLIRLTFAGQDAGVLLFSQAISTPQVRVLRDPMPYSPGETEAMLELYDNDGGFFPYPLGSISVVVETASCDDARRECLISTQRVASAECALPLGVRKFDALLMQCPRFCEESFLRNSSAGPLTFSLTTIGSTTDSVEICPSYTIMAGAPRATRACRGNSVSTSNWEEPAITNCFQGEETQQSLQNLTQYLEDNPVVLENATSVSRDVADATGSNDLTGDDLGKVADLLEKITNVNSSSPKVTSNVVEIVDNILDLPETTYDESLSEEAPIQILRSLEAQLNNLHNGNAEVNFTEVRAFVVAVARSLDSAEFDNPITFGSFFRPGTEDIQENLNGGDTLLLKGKEGYSFDDVKATITLPRSILNGTRYANSDRVPVTFIIHRTSHLFMNQRVPQSDELQVESLITSATVEGERIEVLQEPVVIKFHLLPLEVATDKSSRGCYFWDFSLLNGLGNWSTEGCQLVSGPRTGAADDDELVECHCYHLTNFAILLDVQGDIDSLALDILSIIGCIVSIVALIITIITFLGVKKFRSQRPKQILVHLCFALLGLYLAFLIGINQTNLRIGCIVFGALIQLFCLASVAWMTVEAVNMYLLFVKIFESGITKFMWKASIAAWGGPLIVVIVSVTVRSENYRGGYCFVQAGTLTFYVGVCAFLAALLLGNLATFTLVVHKLSCGRATAIGKDRNIRDEALRYIAISFLLGLTWIFGFLAIGGARFLFNLLFLVFNSLQGFFVFVFFCLRQPEVRAVWWRGLHCSVCRFLCSYPQSGPYSLPDTSTGPSRAVAVPRDIPKDTATTADNNESLQMSGGVQNDSEGDWA